ncbi:MAG: lactonase family protein [Terracidiphilus sp.]
MKLNKPSQLVLVSAAGLLAASLVTACQQFTQTLTIDFVYVASSKGAGANNYGNIDVLEINSESGFMRPIPDSPFPSQGRNPVAEAVSTDNSALFVVNKDDNTVVQFVIGSDGKLYPFNTVNTPGVFPLAIAADSSNLFVLDTYQPLPSCNTAAPCSGSVAVFPLTAASKSTPAAMSSPVVNPATNANYWPLTLPGAPSDVIVPTSVAVAGSGDYVYVSTYDSSTAGPTGYIFGFSVGSNGVLSPLSGSPWAAGKQPSAITADPTGSYLYAADFGSADVLGYSIASGVLQPLSGSPFPAGNQPSAIVADPAYPYLFVTNSLDGNVTAYSMSRGALTRIGSFTTGLDPVAIGVDPSTNRFVYTANFLGNNMNNFVLTTADGSLLNAQYSPFGTHINPTAVAAIPHNGTGGGIKK